MSPCTWIVTRRHDMPLQHADVNIRPRNGPPTFVVDEAGPGARYQCLDADLLELRQNLVHLRGAQTGDLHRILPDLSHNPHPREPCIVTVEAVPQDADLVSWPDPKAAEPLCHRRAGKPAVPAGLAGKRPAVRCAERRSH